MSGVKAPGEGGHNEEGFEQPSPPYINVIDMPAIAAAEYQ
jgi:hypothetical protein